MVGGNGGTMARTQLGHEFLISKDRLIPNLASQGSLIASGPGPRHWHLALLPHGISPNQP